MKKINKNLILIGFLILFPLLCVYYSYLNSSNIMYPGINQATNLKLSQRSELTLNQELKNEHVFTSASYYITVPEGNIHIKVTWDAFWNMDMELSVYSDQSYSELLATSDNPGNEHEFIELYIEEEMTIYIELLAKSGSGFFSIIVHDDAYIDPLTMIIIIIIVVFSSLIAIIIYFKKFRVKKKPTIITPEFKPYPIKTIQSNQQIDDADTKMNFFICPYCGYENLRSSKQCKECGKKLIMN